jgi:hypothetical protein
MTKNSKATASIKFNDVSGRVVNQTLNFHNPLNCKSFFDSTASDVNIMLEQWSSVMNIANTNLMPTLSAK